MAAVLPNPLRFRIDKPSRYISNRQKKIMGRRSPPPVVAAVQTVESKDVAEIKPIETPEEKSSEFFSLKFDNEEEAESPKIEDTGTEVPMND